MGIWMILPISLNSSEVLCDFIGIKQKRGMKSLGILFFIHWYFGIKLQIFSV